MKGAGIKKWWIFLGIFLGLAGAVDAFATVVIPLDLQQLTRQADLIFRGRVLTTEARWDEGRTWIWTKVTFVVDEVIKGDATLHEITLRLPGGAIPAEDVRLKVNGVPEFKEGDDVLIFCSRDPSLRNPIIGWHQGRFKLRVEALSGRRTIEGGRAARLLPVKKSLKSVQGETAAPVSYDDFIGEVKKLMTMP